MIKFFRNIRQRLLSESKLSKYLLYAIGEIILVVIGILLALQLNNWNQERQAHAEECNILSSLLDDLRANEKILEKDQRNMELQISHTRQLLGLMNIDPDETSLIAMDSLIAKGTEVADVQIQMNGLEEIIAKQIGAFKNNRLQQLIMGYPSILQRYKEQEQLMKDIKHNNLRPRIREYVYLGSLFKYDSSFESDRRGLLSDRRFANDLIDRLLESGEWVDHMHDLRDGGIELIEVIETHLDSNCQPAAQ
jgi:hypothetical protein